jgi:glycogen debranching enzyme
VDEFRLAFRIDGYPLEFDGAPLLAGIEVRPEATLFTYSHAAFTVRQVLLAPIDEPGIVMLLDVRSVLPLRVVGSFRPRLKLMWPAGLMTADVKWDEKSRSYALVEESKRFAGAVAVPGGRDLAVMPYQEEPRDVPIRFEIDVPQEAMGRSFVPIAIAGSTSGEDAARETCARLLASAASLYRDTAAHYAALRERTVELATPDARLDQAFAWAKVGVDKGFAANPLLGTGLLAGFRTSGESERPGFGWFFGRDALWTSFAIQAYGDLPASRSALAFLRGVQRPDGKVPHEISQSAPLLPWFTDYPYPWNAADATPLYVIAQAEHFRATGDRAFLEASWDSIRRAFLFTAASDTDGNGLVENTDFGHGWVEGGALYPPHEEIYLQGVWIEACRGLAELAAVLGEPELSRRAQAAAAKARAAVEERFWIAARGHYGFATTLPPKKPPEAEPGPNRARRQARLEELAGERFVDESTVMPAVPLLWGALDPERAQSQLDHLGGSRLTTDWGTRLLDAESRLYDPLSYHAGSVWPLFTGWAAGAAYRHGRPHVGCQALMANALLTEPGALGYVTELLSGDFNAPFGRSSHHQIWSEAMVITPLLRGLLGIEPEDGGRGLRVAPQLPADWEQVEVRKVPAGEGRYDLCIQRRPGRLTLRVEPRAGGGRLPGIRLTAAPAFPLDAELRAASVDDRPARFRPRAVGDVRFAEVVVERLTRPTQIAFEHGGGSDVAWRVEAPEPGATSQGLRVLRSRAEARRLLLVVEGRAGRSYRLQLHTPRTPREVPGVRVRRSAPIWELEVAFAGPGEGYVRREIALPLG